MIHYMFKTGFLGTKAPLFMDLVTLIVALLPLLIFGAILLAKKRAFKLHLITQNIIFVISVLVVMYFEFGVRVGGGFNSFMQDSDVTYSYALIVLISHIIVATLTLFYWSYTIISANYHSFKGLLPGKFSKLHKKMAKLTFLGIIFTSFSGIWIYLLLFVF